MFIVGFDTATLRFVARATPVFYDETWTLASPVTSGTAITLPNSGSYIGEEIEVFVNNIPQDSYVDFNFVGTGTRTQISFTYPLRTGDVLRVRINKGVG